MNVKYVKVKLDVQIFLNTTKNIPEYVEYYVIKLGQIYSLLSNT